MKDIPYYIMGIRVSKKRYKKFRRRSCTRKRRYESIESAECTGCRIYHCEICDGFHRATIRSDGRGNPFIRKLIEQRNEQCSIASDKKSE